MSLPKQVQAQAEEADRLEQELLAAVNPTPEDTTPTEPALTEPEVNLEGEPLEEPQVTEPEPEPVKAVEDETWERKYKTLQGMYNADVPRLRSEVSELKSQLETAIAKLESASTKEPEPTKSQRLVTDQDVEDFGSDLVDLIKRQATEVAQDRIGRLEEENAQLREQLTGVSERQGDIARQTYFADLARLVPDYEEINVDQQFLDWLSEVDPLSGYQRQEYLTNAFNGYDVARTATLFNTFKDLTGSTQAKPKQPPKELARQVAPGTSKASAQTVTNPNEKMWSMSEIDRFYKDVARGVFKGNDAEQARIEAEIDLAVQEGRLTQ